MATFTPTTGGRDTTTATAATPGTGMNNPATPSYNPASNAVGGATRVGSGSFGPEAFAGTGLDGRHAAFSGSAEHEGRAGSAPGGSMSSPTGTPVSGTGAGLASGRDTNTTNTSPGTASGSDRGAAGRPAGQTSAGVGATASGDSTTAPISTDTMGSSHPSLGFLGNGTAAGGAGHAASGNGRSGQTASGMSGSDVLALARDAGSPFAATTGAAGAVAGSHRAPPSGSYGVWTGQVQSGANGSGLLNVQDQHHTSVFPT